MEDLWSTITAVVFGSLAELPREAGVGEGGGIEVLRPISPLLVRSLVITLLVRLYRPLPYGTSLALFSSALIGWLS